MRVLPSHAIDRRVPTPRVRAVSRCGLALALFSAGLASAGSLKVSWTASTRNTDGSALRGTPTYSVFKSDSPAGTKKRIAAGLSLRTFTVDGLVAGSRQCFTVRAVVNGVSSTPSNQVCKTVPQKAAA